MIDRYLSWVLLGLIGLPSLVHANDFLTGIVKPLHSIELSMAVDGVVAEKPASEGDQLKKGDVILRLDDRLQRLEVKRTRAIWQDQSSIEMLRRNREEMEHIALRKEALAAATQSISETEINNVRIQLSNARGEYELASQAKVREKLEYQLSAEVLSLYTLKAPSAGELVEVGPAVGEWVKVGDVIARVVDHRVCVLELNLDIESALRLRQQKDVVIRVHMPNGDLERTGSVEFISPIADEGSTLVRARIQFDNQSGEVVPGVTASLILGQAGES